MPRTGMVQLVRHTCAGGSIEIVPTQWHMPGIISTSAIAKGFLLDGQWISGGAVAEIRSPYDQSIVGAVAVAARAHAEQAIAAAIRAFEITRRMPAFDRQRILREVAQGITQ